MDELSPPRLLYTVACLHVQVPMLTGAGGGLLLKEFWLHSWPYFPNTHVRSFQTLSWDLSGYKMEKEFTYTQSTAGTWSTTCQESA